MKKDRCAVFTMAHNEALFLPIWLKYYSKLFAPQDTYVIDHDTTDGSIIEAKKHYKFNVEKVHRSKVYDNQFMLETIQDMQHKLLERYDVVAYSDADEMILVDPRKSLTLIEYMQQMTEPVGCMSRSVVQQLNEGPLDLSKPILSQRSVWFEEFFYDKVLLSKVPLLWSKGLHTVVDENDVAYSVPMDEDLILLHLARMDYGLRQERGSAIRKEAWGGEGNDAKQQRLKGKELEFWFYHPVNLDYIGLIPERFKEVV